MTDLEQKKKAKEFAEFWKGKGYEKGESQTFWLSLLQDVLGVSDPKSFIKFEDTVHIDKATGFIDGFIPSTKVMIEQKSVDKDLKKAIKQSDGSLLNPFQQALRYANELNNDDRPRWIVTCNFKSFLIYDLNNRNAEPEEVLLEDLEKEYYRLEFLVNKKSEHIKKEEQVSFDAGKIVGQLYDAFSKQYIDLNDENSHKSLNELCVRIVFCLYAEDSGLFGKKSAFHDYLAKFEDLDQMREGLIKLFKVLDTEENKRDKYLPDDLLKFPYVNGGLFSNEEIEIPKFTEEIRNTLLEKASDDFDWSEISPTIFGAVFESTLNPETRRAGGMHYTSIENIHKVIDPLFLDDLRKELNESLAIKVEKKRNEALDKFQEHIASLKFLDPACGSGNFLTETYLSLRRLENEAISAKQHGRMAFDLGDVIKVHINQFYGIEINDFAVKVATTALWIAEAQMLIETEKLLSRHLEFFPLKTYTNIVEGNALRIDWNDVISNAECNYIMGNPPFVGYKFQNIDQKNDIKQVAHFIKNNGTLDYVSCWFIKSTQYMKNTNIRASLVSTNSICQGEHVGTLWSELFKLGIIINFAYRTFKWNNESNSSAQVFCVIIGFSYVNDKNSYIIDEGGVKKKVNNINGYLIDAPNLSVVKLSKPISDSVPIATKGNAAMDDGFLLLEEEEVNALIKSDQTIKQCIKKHVSAEGFINNKYGYCLWLHEVNPNLYRNNKFVMERLGKVKDYREKSNRNATKKMAKYPMLFAEIRQPKSKYIIIPVVSSDRRRYVPIGFLEPDIINSYASISIPNATMYDFGILNSNIHNAWIRLISGRLGTDYRYATTLVYNTFPWPSPTKEQKETIEKTAKLILDIRAKYPDSSLADLYDELTMPADLRKAHQMNDKAVMNAYGFKTSMTESECVAELMKMYQNMVNNLK